MFLDLARSFRRSAFLSRRPASRRNPRPRRPEVAAERLENRALLSAVTFSQKFEGVDWTSAGAGGVGNFWTGGASASLNVSGVQGQVVAAYLYWQGLDLVSFGGDGVYDNAAVTFEGAAVTGVSLGTGSSASWGAGGSQAFRADVTGLVRAGKTAYAVSGLASKKGHSADGVSLVVVYQDGDRTNDRDLYVLDGNAIDAGTGADGAWNVRLDDFAYRFGDVRAQLHVADGQVFADAALSFSATSGAGYAAVFPDKVGVSDGSSVQNMGRSRATNGSLWDIHNFDLSSAFANAAVGPGKHSLALNESNVTSDALSLVVLLFDTHAQPPNEPPVASNMDLAGLEDEALSGQLDAHDPQGDSTLTYSLVTDPAVGVIDLDEATGRFVFTPPKDFNGVVRFVYAATDGEYAAAATVTLTVAPVNDVPVAPPQQAATDEDAPLAGVLSALDADGDSLSFALVSGPSHGSLTLAADGRYVFTPACDWSGDDAFTVSVTDGKSDPVTFVVAIHVDPVNDTPDCPSQCLATDEDVPLAGALAATDADGDPLSFLLVDGPAHGSLLLGADGKYLFTPDKDWYGDDSFRVTVSDGKSDPVTLLVSVHVDAVNDLPVAGPVEFRAAAHAAVGTVVGTFAATDVDGDRLVYAIAGGDPNGAFAIDPNTGVLTVADRKQLNGGAVFTLTVSVSDGHGGTASALVTVRVLKEQLSFKVGRAATNVVNLDGLRWQPVVIYSNSGFDARQIDVKSLSFGRTGNERSFVNDHGRHHWFTFIDVNGDGRKDLVILFDARKTGLRAGDTSVTLKGRMKDGSSFAGSAPVTVKSKAKAEHGRK